MGSLNRGLFPDTPTGAMLPIPCTYPFGPGGDISYGLAPPRWNTPLPEGWHSEWIQHTDPRPEEAGFISAPLWVDEEAGTASFEEKPGTKPVAYLYLLDHEDKLVATWDEGRWWTPDESDQFQLMLQVPATIDVTRLGKRGEYGQGHR